MTVLLLLTFHFRAYYYVMTVLTLELLMSLFNGDKMNVAALGNVVPQLHLHHIVRFKSDACWPKPIWGQQALTPYSDDELTAIKNRILPKLSAILSTDS